MCRTAGRNIAASGQQALTRTFGTATGDCVLQYDTIATTAAGGRPVYNLCVKAQLRTTYTGLDRIYYANFNVRTTSVHSRALIASASSSQPMAAATALECAQAVMLSIAAYHFPLNATEGLMRLCHPAQVLDGGTFQNHNSGTPFTRAIRVPPLWKFNVKSECPRAQYDYSASSVGAVDTSQSVDSPPAAGR